MDGGVSIGGGINDGGLMGGRTNLAELFLTRRGMVSSALSEGEEDAVGTVVIVGLGGDDAEAEDS